MDDLACVTAPHEWIIRISFAVALIAAFSWSAFGSLDRTLIAEGLILYPGERYTVQAGAVGVVTDVPVGVKDGVAKGEPIAHVLSPELEAQLASQLAYVTVLEREAGTDERLAAARQELARLTQRRGEGAVLAPYAGVVSALHLHVGQAVAVGTPLADLRMGESGRVEVVAYLPPAEARELGKGMKAQVFVGGLTDEQPLPGQVVMVAPEPAAPPAWFTRLLSEGGGTHGQGAMTMVRLNLLQEPDMPLSDAMPCRVRIIVETATLLDLLADTESAPRQ